MGDESLHEGRATSPAEAGRGLRAQWRSLSFAVAISLLAHVVLLSLFASQPQRRAARPEAAVSLTGTIVVAQPAPVETASPPAPQPPAVPPPSAAATPSPSEAPAPRAASPRKAASEPTPPAPAPAAEEATRPPVPRDDPFLGEKVPELVGRRLAVALRLRADGTVERAEVTRNEISPELVSRLEQALARVRFPPGSQDPGGGNELRTRLCFDDAGRLDMAGEDCWPHGLPAQR